MPSSALITADSPASARSLYDIVLPGTHDSAAYTARPDLVSRSTVFPLLSRPIRRVCSTVQTDFALTQTLTVLQQLRAGARFLDIRVSKRPPATPDQSFWTVHGMVLCAPLQEILAQINEFHNETEGHHGCTVVSVFRSQLLTADEEDELAQFIAAQLQHPVYDGDRNELRDIPYICLPRNVVAGLKSCKLDVAWGRDAWIDTYSADKKIAFLRRTLAVTKHRGMRNDLFVLGWTVTPSVWDVTFRVLSLGSLRPAVIAEASKMNERFSEFLNAEGEELGLRANVVFFDCFSETHAQMIAKLNQQIDTDDSAS